MVIAEMDPSQEKAPGKKSCFVIAPIGKDDSDTRRRSDMLLEHVFMPALVPVGYEVIRADRISEPGSITLQVLNHILEADLVIADLTDHNPNVFYELAVRHALNKGVIHVICAGQVIPFDIADLRTIHIVLDIPGAARAVAEISAQAKQLESGEVGKTPIGLANILSRSEGSKTDESVLIREMLDRMTELGSGLRELSKSQERSRHVLERRIDFLTHSLRRQQPKTKSSEQVDASLRVTAEQLDATVNEMPSAVRDKFSKFSEKQKRIAADLFEMAMALNPDKSFGELLGEAVRSAENSAP